MIDLSPVSLGDSRAKLAPWGTGPGRLWSLWDMLEKYAAMFAASLIHLNEVKWICATVIKEGRDGPEARRQIFQVGDVAIQETRDACIAAVMERVLPEIDRVLSGFNMLIATEEYTLETVSQALKHLVSRIDDELNAHLFFHVDSRDAFLYGQKELFGDRVSKKFANAISDIEGAGSCLALRQPTASVFHLMRIMEIGVQKLGNKLKVNINTNVESWAKIIDHVNVAINAMASKTEAEKKKKAKYAAASTYLHHVRLAWRNDVMHPKGTHTLAEAHDILSATRAFMTHLAELV